MIEMCPEHPSQPAIHCACPAGRATFPCPSCAQMHQGPFCTNPTQEEIP